MIGLAVDIKTSESPLVLEYHRLPTSSAATEKHFRSPFDYHRRRRRRHRHHPVQPAPEISIAAAAARGDSACWCLMGRKLCQVLANRWMMWALNWSQSSIVAARCCGGGAWSRSSLSRAWIDDGTLVRTGSSFICLVCGRHFTGGLKWKNWLRLEGWQRRSSVVCHVGHVLRKAADCFES